MPPTNTPVSTRRLTQKKPHRQPLTCVYLRNACVSAICSRSFHTSGRRKRKNCSMGLARYGGKIRARKIVVFATYLGTVDLIAREINRTFPGQGVVVLRGGDHGAKVAAERKFHQKDGPRVMVCTAAGREGINLQFARILFNFDLPWNPMDVEQRIGRIHRYGQNHTAQVYNLVLSDTIEGRIFLLLDEKLTEIARTVGKVDDKGNVAEEFAWADSRSAF